MRLAVIGGAGRIGSRIVTEALGRGHEVTAVVRDRSRLAGEPPRLIVVGGFGSLRDPTGQQYADRPGLPAQAAPEIVGQRDALTYYRGVEDLHWTYVSPPPGGIAPGERTGTFRVARNTIGDREVSSTLVSMEDYAIAVVDEAELAEHRHACVVVMR